MRQLLCLVVACMAATAGAGPTIHGNVGSTVTSTDSRSTDPTAMADRFAVEHRSGALSVVQLDGPPRDEALAAIRAAGVTVLQYMSRFRYLVWVESEAAAKLSQLGFVRRQKPYLPESKIEPALLEKVDSTSLVSVIFFIHDGPAATLTAIERGGGFVRSHHPAQPNGMLHEAVVEIDPEALAAVAAIGTVVWLGSASPSPVLSDERSDSVVAGRYAGGAPLPDYRSWLDELGLDGSGVRWAVVDSGVDPFHPDLDVAVGISYPGCDTPEPGDDPGIAGHGTPVAGIIAGSGAGGFADAEGFSYGLGVAPAATLVSQNAICGEHTDWPPSDGWQKLSRDGLSAGAIGMNDSWNSGEGTAHGYQATERAFDLMVRDGDWSTPGVAEPYFVVFSVHNDGPGPQTIHAPSEAKNIIAVGAVQNARDEGDIERIAEFSGRGPAVDGRVVPTVVAPGEWVTSARHRDGGIFGLFEIPGTDGLYLTFTGTSAAAPHVSGAIALLTQWWRRGHGGADPSPAMVKALLVNGAVDVAGAPPIPNPDEGWGRIDLGNTLRPGVRAVHLDQTVVLDDSGDAWSLEIEVDDPSRPLKVTLAWTDAPGMPGADPALVNDLDLELVGDGTTYLGNAFVDGWSAPGGEPDAVNNLENIYLATPGATASIKVRASVVAGDGVPMAGDATDQDFALVCSNCRRPLPPPRRATGRVGGQP